MPKIIIIGATSGIGRALAREYAGRGYEVGITGRRMRLLEELRAVLPGKCYVQPMDVTDAPNAMMRLRSLLERMHPVDLIIVNAGTGHVNPALAWDMEQTCIATNVCGFAGMCNVAIQYFGECGRGHLAGVSSIAGLRGVGGAPAYSASKAFISNYLESLRGMMYRQQKNILVTDIRPGFVDTVMGRNPKAFWIASPETAAQQIAAALTKGQTKIYVTKRWHIIAWLLRCLPDALLDRIG